MTIDDKIRDEKPQYDINRKTAKISVFSSGKIESNEYLADEEILSSNQRQIIEQAKFTYSPLGKAFEKEIKKKKKEGETNKTNRKQSQKNVFRHRSKIDCSFVSKRFSKRTYIWTEQNCRHGK